MFFLFKHFPVHWWFWGWDSFIGHAWFETVKLVANAVIAEIFLKMCLRWLCGSPG